MYITCYSHLSLAEIAMQSFVLISMFLICFSTPLTQIGLCMSINTLISRSTFIYKSRVYVKSRSNGICVFFCTWCVRWIGKLFFVIFVFIIMYYFLNSLILLIYKHWQDIFYKYFFDVIMFNCKKNHLASCLLIDSLKQNGLWNCKHCVFHSV